MSSKNRNKQHLERAINNVFNNQNFMWLIKVLHKSVQLKKSISPNRWVNCGLLRKSYGNPNHTHTPDPPFCEVFQDCGAAEYTEIRCSRDPRSTAGTVDHMKHADSPVDTRRGCASRWKPGWKCLWKCGLDMKKHIWWVHLSWFAPMWGKKPPKNPKPLKPFLILFYFYMKLFNFYVNLWLSQANLTLWHFRTGEDSLCLCRTRSATWSLEIMS